MFRALLAFVRPLHTLARATVRIADALERMSPPPGLAPEPTVFTTDEESLALEDRRREQWEAGHGRLRPGEYPPDEFEATSDERSLKEFFGPR